MITVIKSNGQREPLNLDKVQRVCQRVGAPKELCQQIARSVEERARDGIKTRDIYKLVHKLLVEQDFATAARFNLRDAIFQLGPLGYNFEHYVEKVLAAYGYKTSLPPILQGACVTHEVDVLAKKDNRTAMVECKFRHTQEIFITIKDTMSTWARFLDLVDGAAIGKCSHLDECWIVTNSRFSLQSIQFGHCKNMVMLSWDHPRERPLPAWIDDKGLYPITLLPKYGLGIQRKFIEAGFVLLRDLAGADSDKLARTTGIALGVAKDAVADAREILRID